MGWLHAIPRSKAEKTLDCDTRHSKSLKDEAEIQYPPCQLMYMIDYFFSAGPVTPTAMGSVPLSHSEIWAWQQNMELSLCPWESNTLRDMSRQYLSELLQSDKHDSPPPWVPEMDAEHSKLVAKKVKDILRG